MSKLLFVVCGLWFVVLYVIGCGCCVLCVILWSWCCVFNDVDVVAYSTVFLWLHELVRNDHSNLITFLFVIHLLPVILSFFHRVLTLILTVVTLNMVHHSPLLAVCAVFTGAAAYLQSTFVSVLVCLCACVLVCLCACVCMWPCVAVLFVLFGC